MFRGGAGPTRNARLPDRTGRVDRKAPANKILRHLSAADFALLSASLSPVDLPLRRQLENRNRRIEHVYFLDTGLASMVVSAGANHSVEVGIIGNEGMTGLAVVLGSDRSVHETFIQTAGAGWRIETDALRELLKESPTLHASLLRFAHILMIQMSFTVLANGRYKIDERLARWLLMADDRASGDTIHLTHEFLSLMLGARRPGITHALNDFEKRGLIAARRGAIMIKDRTALEEAANGSYGAPESEYQRLLGA